MKIVYRYYTLLRPPLPGAIPRKGLVRVGMYDDKQSIGGIGAWGFAEYDSPLTDKQIDDYDLSPSRNNPLVYED